MQSQESTLNITRSINPTKKLRDLGESSKAVVHGLKFKSPHTMTPLVAKRVALEAPSRTKPSNILSAAFCQNVLPDTKNLKDILPNIFII